MGIDSSLNHVGLARFDQWNKGEPEIEYKTIVPDTKHTFQRYHDVMRYAMSWIDQETLVVMENYGFAASGQLVQLGGQGEMLRYRIWKRTGNGPLMVAPGQLKKFMSGSGRMDKNSVLMLGLKNYGIEFKTTDECEAYALVRLALEMTYPSKFKTAPKYKKEVFAELSKRMVFL